MDLKFIKVNMAEIKMAFASIDKVQQILVPELKEVKVTGSQMVGYGTDNHYPDYLYGLYTDVTSLKTVVEGTADYVCGNDITSIHKLNNKNETWREFVFNLSRDYLLYGGFAFEVIRTKDLSQVAELHYIDFRDIRSDEENEVFYYNPDFKKKYVKTSKTIVFERFKEDLRQAKSIVYYKNNHSTVYPIPRYSGALKCCEIERGIDTMHLAGIENGFYGSYIVNINSGIPDDEEKKQLEKDFNEKFCGAGNAGRFVLNFSNGKDNQATLQKLDVVDFSDKYKAAATRSREQIYASFRAIPALFGVMTETTGFNEQEFSEAFKLYNRTVVKPIQIVITDEINKVYNEQGVINIVPFSLEYNNEQTVE